MKGKPRSPEDTYALALARGLAELKRRDPTDIAARAACLRRESDGEGNYLEVPYFGQLHQLAWPSGRTIRVSDAAEPDIATRIILLHYLLHADGTPLAGEWVAFRSLPGGLGYDAAFSGRASNRIANSFGADQSGFEAAAESLRGERLTFGDSSYLFRILPRVWMAVVLYLADDEFPAAANVLFDASASHYLPTEDLAVLGGILASRLGKARP